jgi:2-polyprenyl-6-methoxyphenol hydroxylase-like FAD-dependent oxidoreductase
MMCGFLLARAGVDVLVLEKHADFFRDFRGDTIHPSTLQIMYELGLLDQFLKLPHSEVHELGGEIGDDRILLADFSHLPTHCHFIALMPQWDFLDFLAQQAKKYPSFKLKMLAEVDGLLQDGETIVGLTAKQPDGRLEVRSDLVIDAAGRHSTVREKAWFKVDDLGAPMDVLWFRLPKEARDGGQTLGRIQTGVVFIMLDRGDYWQCAYVTRKGGFAELRRKGLDTFREAIVALNPKLADRVHVIASWDEVKLLTVAVDRLQRWYRKGLLCIGDAAHAMSPIGGVGINLAIQDAVAAANILWRPLRDGDVSEDDLRKVQERRKWPMRAMQRLQIFIQDRVISSVLALKTRPRAPAVVKLLNVFPILRRIPARLIGLGFRPEHVHVPELPPKS